MSSSSRCWFGTRKVALAVAVVALGVCLCGSAMAAETSQRSSSASLQMCTGKYALCDAAVCTPIAEQQGYPGPPEAKPSHALCTCVVENGQNLGPGPCSDRVPRGKKGEYILSTYSYALHKPYLTCPAGGNRTVCFGYPCLIDEKDPKRAHCTCPINYDSGEFKTQGGGCNVASCSKDLWQGGTQAEYDAINAIFTKATGQPAPANCAAIVKPK
jgi:Zn-finger protein